jgi:purine-binding chemotaxis protein CheW
MSGNATELADKAATRNARGNQNGYASTGGGKFLTFFLCDEEYGLEILRVHEIIRMMSITPVPRTPLFIKGVINLRGKVIPIVDLRTKLNMASMEQTDQTCIIVVHANGLEVGIIVDQVSEVLDIAGKDIEPAPSFGASVNANYILGIGKSEGRVRLLLDIDEVLFDQGMDYLTAAASTIDECGAEAVVSGITGESENTMTDTTIDMKAA